MPDVSNQTNIKYRQSFYTLAIVLLIILFIYYIHIALYHCPRVRKKGRKKTKQETSTQYKVTDPISMADLEHILLRKVISQ